MIALYALAMGVANQMKVPYQICILIHWLYIAPSFIITPANC